jgi:predicted amidohydrolase YtcJ
MAKVWVQVWTARVPGSVEVEETDLKKVEGLESLKKMVPMLVKETAHSEWAMVADWSRSPLVSVEETVEVLPPLENPQSQD